MLGADIIAKEERDKTVEFLFTKPLLRSTIITAKLLAAFVNIVVFNLITLISLITFLGKYNRDGEAINGHIALTMVGMFILQILFMVVGSAIASVKRNPKSVASLATGILLFSYLLSIAIDLNENLAFLKYITPFKYFEAEMVMYDGGLNIVYVLISVVVIAVLAFVTYVFFNKRDLDV
ncbi:MAG TPA: ABC transporter permease subunit, partial [Bacillus sp. (in: firmicutes)]|nr:ABC transporter permease subunit [Bacillus sp. (in: firmicutes)]